VDIWGKRALETEGSARIDALKWKDFWHVCGIAKEANITGEGKVVENKA